MDGEITSTSLQCLLGIGKSVLSDLVADGIVVRGEKRGTYKLEASVSRYCAHLRSMAAGRGGEAGVSARERLGQAQAMLAETKAKQLAGELIEVAEVETFQRGKLKAFRNRILAIPHRVKDLTARQNAAMTQELRAALDELAEDKSTLTGKEE